MDRQVGRQIEGMDAVAERATAGERAWASGIGIFAGAMLATLGIFEALQGLSAISKDDLYQTRADYVLGVDLTTWGWIHLLVGSLAVVVGVCILLGQRWAFLAGICVALVAALSSFAFMPYYPFWALAVIAFSILVIWAMTVLMASSPGTRRHRGRH